MRDFGLIAFVLLMLPVAAMNPHVGIYLWYWISYMNPHRLTWGPAFDYPFAQLIAIATLAGLFLSRVKLRVPWSLPTLMLIAFTLWTSVTTIFAINDDEAVPQWEQFVKIQLMTFVTLLVITDAKRLRILIWVTVMSIGFYGIKGGIFTILRGGLYRVYGPPGGMIEGNNELALALILVLPLMRYLQLVSVSAWIRWGLAAAMVLCGFSILGSQSRGAFIAAAAVMIAIVAKSRRRLFLVPGLVLVVVLLFNFAPDRWIERMGTIETYDQDRSALGRINAWHFAVNLAKDRPVVGGGFDVFHRELFRKYAPDPEDFHDSHSIYFGVLAEHGFVGLGLFLVLGLSTFAMGRWIRRQTRDRDELQWAADLGSMAQASMIGFAVGGMFLGLAYFDLPYILVAIMIIVRSIILNTEPEPEPEPEPSPASRKRDARRWQDLGPSSPPGPYSSENREDGRNARD